MKMTSGSRSPEPFRKVLQLDQQGVFVPQQQDPYQRQLQRMQQLTLSLKKPRQVKKALFSNSPTKYQPLKLQNSPKSRTIAQSQRLRQASGSPVLQTCKTETNRFSGNVAAYTNRQKPESDHSDGQLSARKPQIIKELCESLSQSVDNGGIAVQRELVAQGSQTNIQRAESLNEKRSAAPLASLAVQNQSADMQLNCVVSDQKCVETQSYESTHSQQKQKLELPEIPQFKGEIQHQEFDDDCKAPIVVSARTGFGRNDAVKLEVSEAPNSKLPAIPAFKGEIPKLPIEDQFTRDFIQQIKTVRGVRNEKPLFQSRFQQVHLDDGNEDLEQQMQDITAEAKESDVQRSNAPAVRGRLAKQDVNASFLQNQMQIITENAQIVEKQSRFAKQQIGFNESKENSENSEQNSDKKLDDIDRKLNSVHDEQRMLQHELVQHAQSHKTSSESSLGPCQNVQKALQDTQQADSCQLAKPRTYRRFEEEKMNASFLQNQMEIIGKAQPIIEQESRFGKKQMAVYAQGSDSGSDSESGHSQPQAQPVETNTQNNVAVAKSRFKPLLSMDSFQQDQQKIMKSAHQIKEQESRFGKVQTASFDTGEHSNQHDCLQSGPSKGSKDDILQFQQSARGPRQPVTESRFQVQKQLDDLSEMSVSDAHPLQDGLGEQTVCKQQEANPQPQEQANGALLLSQFQKPATQNTQQSRFGAGQLENEISEESDETIPESGLTTETLQRVQLQCLPSFNQNQMDIIQKQIKRTAPETRFKALGEDPNESSEGPAKPKPTFSRFSRMKNDALDFGQRSPLQQSDSSDQ